MMGFFRKATSLSTAGLVDFRSDKGLFGFQWGVIAVSRSQSGLPA